MERRTALVVVLVLVVVVGSLLAGCSGRQGTSSSSGGGPGKCSWTVYFSPNGGATDAVVNTIYGAKKSVLVQAYSFTSAPIAKALVNAHKRGVDVRVILDKSNATAKYTAATFLTNAAIPTKIDYAHAIAHNKVMVIDGDTVVTGSFNYTKSAEKSNAENLLIIHDPELARRYTRNWELHAAHSETYVRGKGGRGYTVPPTYGKSRRRSRATSFGE